MLGKHKRLYQLMCFRQVPILAAVGNHDIEQQSNNVAYASYENRLLVSKYGLTALKMGGPACYGHKTCSCTGYALQGDSEGTHI